MAHFFAEVQGSRGAVHRLGGKSSGATARVQTWDKGIEVHAYWDEDTQQNIFVISETGGSNGGSASKHLLTVQHG